MYEMKSISCLFHNHSLAYSLHQLTRPCYPIRHPAPLSLSLYAYIIIHTQDVLRLVHSVSHTAKSKMPT